MSPRTGGSTPLRSERSRAPCAIGSLLTLEAKNETAAQLHRRPVCSLAPRPDQAAKIGERRNVGAIEPEMATTLSSNSARYSNQGRTAWDQSLAHRSVHIVVHECQGLIAEPCGCLRVMGDKTHESNSSSDTIVRNTLAKSEKASPSRSLILHKCTMESSEAGRAPAIGYGYRAARQGDWSWGRVLRSKSVAVRDSASSGPIWAAAPGARPARTMTLPTRQSTWLKGGRTRTAPGWLPVR